MPAWLTALRDLIADASPLRRVMLAMLVVLPFVALGAAWFWFNPVEYRVLYPRLSDRAGGEVLVALEQLDIPYRLSADDGRIEVPAGSVHVARYRLAAQGLPRTDEAVRAEAEDSPRFGASSQQEQQRLQRALEAELARSVQTLEPVAFARVHLALPKVSPFLRDAPPATAAVLVRLKAGAALSAEQVATIQTLVAASVPRLARSDVQVFDPRGVQHSAAPAEAAESPRMALERELAQRVRAVLAPWLGEAGVTVQVTATLDDSETRRTVERVRNVTVGGHIRPLEKTVQTTVLPEGRLARLDAIVVLDFDASREVRLRATQLARQALGYSAARGDTLNVYVLPAARQAQALAEPPGGEAAAPVNPEPVTVPVSIPPLRAQEKVPAVDYRLLGALALLGIVLAGGALFARLRRRSATVPVDTADDFDALLDAAREQTLDNPRVTADVIKLWMRA
ncbi:MAG TPA: flagellar basal-body MS-ring/collar protein FliF [Thiobacillus sp.]|nr:flagellar basal-body MS-ring/collar protein FliF [Thiobacillus sp.]